MKHIFRGSKEDMLSEGFTLMRPAITYPLLADAFEEWGPFYIDRGIDETRSLICEP